LNSSPPPRVDTVPEDSSRRLGSARSMRSSRMMSVDGVASTARLAKSSGTVNPLDSRPRVHALVDALVWTGKSSHLFMQTNSGHGHNLTNVLIFLRCGSDYFNNMLKCWEPLIEPVSFGVLYGQVIRKWISMYH
jgi:hypothetical protein